MSMLGVVELGSTGRVFFKFHLGLQGQLGLGELARSHIKSGKGLREDEEGFTGAEEEEEKVQSRDTLPRLACRGRSGYYICEDAVPTRPFG